MTGRDIFLAVIIALIWGLNFVVIKIGIDEFPPLMFSALRFLLAAFPLVLFFPKPDVPWRIIISIGLILGVIKFALLFIGMDMGLSAGLASIVLQVQAFFTVMLAVLIYREMPGRQQVIGMFVAFGGIALIASTIDATATFTGLMLVLGAGFAWAISNLIMKRARPIKMVNLMVWVSIIPPIPLIILSLVFEGWQANAEAFSKLSLQGMGSVIYISYFTTILAFAGWGRLITKYGAGRVAPFSLLVPAFGMTSSAIFLGEEFGATRLTAVVLICIGLGLSVFHKKKGRTRS